MDLLEIVRLVAKRRPADRSIRRDLTGATGEWAEVERTLLGELSTRPRRVEGLLRAFERVAKLCGQKEAIGRAARLRGSTLAYLGRPEESLGPYETAAGELRGAARDGARLGTASSLLRLGRADEAIQVCRRVRRAARRRGDQVLAAGADLNEAVALHESGRPEAALGRYERAEGVFGEAGIVQMAATARENRANALVLLDRYDEAAPLYESAAADFDRLGVANEAARCRYNQGALLVATDRLGDADEVLIDAEESFRRTGDPVHAALCRLDRGEALLRAGLLPEARHALRSARRGHLRGAPPVERARATLLLARTLIAQGEGSSARRLLRRPLPLDSKAASAERLELLGRADAADSLFPRARERLLEAARIFGARRPANRARSLLAAASCALEEGDLAGARRLIRRAGRAADALGLPGLMFGASAVEFLVEDRAGRRPSADAALECALSALEGVRDGLGPDAMRAALLRGREAWFARAVRHALDGENGEDRALMLVERFRARALLDLLGDSDRLAPRDERVTVLRARVAALERRALSTVGSGFLRADRARVAPAVLSRLAAAERELQVATGRSLRAGTVPPADPGEVASRLPAGTVVLSLFADGEGSCLFTMDRDGVTAASQAATLGEIGDLVGELHFYLGQFTVGSDFAKRHRRRIRRSTDRLLREIAERTLDPVAEALRGAKRLVIVPHGPWHLVPFAALPFDGAPLVDSLTVRLAPAIAAMDGGPRAARGRSLVLSYQDRLAPRIAEEARSVAAVLTGARLLEGESARTDALEGRAAPRCLHIASHGRYRPDAPWMSGVLLADGWLRAGDFPALSLDGSLVVLSGCETGVATVDAGNEVHGLVRGVFASGCTELVASLWRVDDATTSRLISRFHELRAAGRTADVALSGVQRELAGEGLHPWYWAGFSNWSRRLAR